jgi:hypothetical protein
MENSQMLLSAGYKLRKTSKVLASLLGIGIGCLLVTLLLCGEYALRYLAVSGYYFEVNLLVLLCYISIVLGSWFAPCYFFGMVLIGLGQICRNTEPRYNGGTAPMGEFASASVPTPVPEPAAVPTSAPKPAAAPATESQKPTGPSLALVNSLHAALNEPDDEDMVRRLEEAKMRLTRPSEQRFIQQILDAPGDNIRPIVQRLYTKFKPNT